MFIRLGELGTWLGLLAPLNRLVNQRVKDVRIEFGAHIRKRTSSRLSAQRFEEPHGAPFDLGAMMVDREDACAFDELMS